MNIEREDIHIISRHSNWPEDQVDKMLQEEVYKDKAQWQQFLSLLFISLGVSFTAAGIVFFFAYNWADLHKFVKLGLIESLIVLSTLAVLLLKVNADIKNVLLTGAAILVGVLFAVFGQIYQTGANAYDFFLGWTLFISLWVLVANFAPLWLVFITLINTTLVLYAQQVAHDWSDMFVFALLFILNVFFLLAALLVHKLKAGAVAPMWFTNILALGASTIATVGIVMGIFGIQENSFLGLLMITMIAYGAGISYALKTKNSFYLALIPLSVIIIIAAFLLDISDEASMLFFISFFIVASVSLVVRGLIKLHKNG